MGHFLDRPVGERWTLINLSIYLGHFPHFGGSRQYKETIKTMGVSLRSSSNDEGPSQVWMALLEQHSSSPPPRLPQLASLHRCQLPYCPYHRVASIRQPHGNSRCQSELRHNHSPLIPIPSTLTCLSHIHPPIIQGSLYSIHPPKPRPPSTFTFITFFSSRSLSILST